MWHHRRQAPNNWTKPEPNGRKAGTLEGLEIEREYRRPHKPPSKLFHDMIRWELRQQRFEDERRWREIQDALAQGKYDPFEREIYAKQDATLGSEELKPRKGDVLLDPKIRPHGYVHPALRLR